MILSQSKVFQAGIKLSGYFTPLSIQTIRRKLEETNLDQRFSFWVISREIHYFTDRREHVFSSVGKLPLREEGSFSPDPKIES